MKTILPIKLALLFFLVLSTAATAQFTNPERDTKWNLGFNMGGVWQDGDVQLDRPGFGYGFTLGKGIYESQGKFWSVDLRFRYMKGKTFGQNLSLTDSASIDDNSIYAQNPTNYKATQGLLFLNTETALHDFSLEAVINFHALREKTGILLSVFGGIGITDYRTKTDLLYTPEGQSFDKMYDFSSIDTASATKSDFRNLQDGDYESFAPFSEDKSVRVMPSLGIGLGYQFSPQWSVGFEHRVTFTLRDKFDGIEQAGTQFLQWGDNDKYHYSSVFLRWNIFRGDESSTTTTSRNCPPPYLRISDLPEIYEVNEKLLEVRARVSKIKSNNDVMLVANDQIEQTIYNPNTDYVVGTVSLVEGRNKIYYLATNGCGETIDSVIVIYNPNFCPKAELTFLQPAEDSVSAKEIQLQAEVLRLQEGSIEVQLNNEIAAHQFDEYSNRLSAELLLNVGVNTISVKVTNKCGDTTVTKRIVYYCVSPSVSILTPAQGIKSEGVSTTFKATTQHIQNKTQVEVKLNGTTIPFSFSNSNISGSLKPVIGNNELTMTVTNDCGTDTKTIVWENEEPCYLPIAMITEPTLNQTAANSIINFEGSVTNVSNSSDIQLFLNGYSVPFRFNNANGDVLATLNLNLGTNIIILTASNSCGSDEDQEQVIYNCPSPLVFISNPNNGATINSPNLSLQGNATNVTLKNQVRVLVNGFSVPFTFNSNGNFALIGTLRPGQNTITVTANTNCGTDSKTISVLYNQPCPPPFVTITSQGNGSSVGNSFITLTGTALNLNSQSNMSVQLNGMRQPFSWNSQTQMYNAGLNLREGNNTILVMATTSCGTDSKSISINYKKACPKPTASITSPRNGMNLSTQTVSFSGVVTNIQSASQVQLKVNGNRVNSSFNASSGLVTANISLMSGSNSIELIVSNNCGTDISNTTVSYRCPLPTVNISAPMNGMSYTTNQVNFKGFVSGVSSKNQITLSQNGNPISFNYDTRTSKFSGTMNLSIGSNTLLATVTNQCGSVNNSVSVSYTKSCPSPTVSITSPSNGTTSTTGTILISGIANNINSQSELVVTVNGSIVNVNYNASTRKFTATATAQSGNNLVRATVMNNCGEDEKSVSVSYTKSCPSPTVSITSPSNGTTSTTGTILISGIANNINSQSELVVTVNGSIVNVNYNASTRKFTATATAQSGNNLVRATVMNNCGEDEKSVSVSYTKSCPSPTVSITSPGNGSKLNTNKVTINGTALNVSQKSNIDIRINGSSVNFSYNASNNKFSATVTLKTGVNSIMVSVKTECGVDSEVVSVTYSQPCNAPSILINSPKHKAELVSSSSLLKGFVTGIKSVNQIELSVNGIRQAVNYSSLSSEFSTMLKLVAGTNRINISVRNECGEDAKSIQVNYTPPCPKPTVKILTPKNDLTINDNKVIVTGIATSLVNASDLMIKVNGVSQPVNYSFSTRSFTATVVLTPNIRNTIVAIVETNCGMASQSISVNSVQVQKPVIDLENPATDSSTTTFDNAKLFGSVSGITTPAKFEIRVNGTKVTDYILTKRGLEYYTFNGVLTLVNGVNVISIKATHSSGGVEIKTIVITKSGVNYMKSPNKIGGSEKTKEITPAKSTPTRSRNKR